MLKSIVKVQLIVRFLLLLEEKETNVSDIVNWDLVINAAVCAQTNEISVQIH